MVIEEREESIVTVLKIKGDLVGDDIKNFNNKLEALHKAQKNKIVINLEQVNTMDSLALDIIDSAIQNGMQINLVQFPTRLLNFFYHAKINKSLNIYSQEKSAIQAILYEQEASSSKDFYKDRRTSPRIPASFPAAIIVKTEENDIIFPNAFTRNISSNGAWLEYADVSELYDFKILFSFGLREKHILNLYLDITRHKNIQHGLDKKESLHITSDLLRIQHNPGSLGIGLKFREQLKHTHFLSLLPK